MDSEIVCQGRRMEATQLAWLRDWIAAHPQWSRKRLARELSREWDWRNQRGQLKDFAARSFLAKLAARQLIVLPAVQAGRRTRAWGPAQSAESDWPTEAVQESLEQLQPLHWRLPSPGSVLARRFGAYLEHYHYLGLRVVGENLKYLVQDRRGRDLALLLFGAAAWRASARDQFIGWDQAQRARGLNYLANNTRLLIPPWVEVAGLASHLLSQVARRINADWQAKYGRGLYLLESFVQRDRFAGTCYQAANWQRVGQTCGRGRQGADPRRPAEPVKDVYVYPLNRRFRQLLVEVA